MKRVSISIPCRNEEKYIGRCLQSIVDCSYPKALLTVYVCDGLSDDQTPAIINDFAARYSFIHYLVNEKKKRPRLHSI